jgi:hypothetical protein
MISQMPSMEMPAAADRPRSSDPQLVPLRLSTRELSTVTQPGLFSQLCPIDSDDLEWAASHQCDIVGPGEELGLVRRDVFELLERLPPVFDGHEGPSSTDSAYGPEPTSRWIEGETRTVGDMLQLLVRLKGLRTDEAASVHERHPESASA